MAYDPAFMNTAACRSAITYIDGDKGILRYRGYPIEQLAEKSTFLETAYLLLDGELPSAAELDGWVYQVTHHTIIHENIKKFIDGFHHDAHPMGMFVSAVAALSTFYTEAKRIADEKMRSNQIVRLIAKTPTLAAFAHRHFPEHDVQDDRGEIQPAPGPRARARRPVHPACRSRAELLDQRDAGDRLVPSRSLLVHGGSGGRAVRATARRRERRSAADAARNRIDRRDSRLPPAREEGRRTADGLRPPRVQELRPARQDHQTDRGAGVRRDGQEPAHRHRGGARADRAAGRVLRRAQALSQRRFLFGHHL